jgi:prepilin-type N-terminal cleavage/methylation domain-containing protein
MTKRPETGMTLIEMMVSSLIFAVVVSMVLIMVSTLDSTTTQSIETSQEAEQAQTAASVLEQYLGNTVSPLVAAIGAGNPASEPSAALSTTSPCWGASQPSSGNSLAGTNAQTVTSPSRLAITVAHDFDLVFCADKPGSATPHVYEANLADCTSATYGDCTLQIVDYGASCAPGTGSPGVTGSGCSTGRIAASVQHVWCDAYCQGNTGAGVNPQSTSVAKACWTTSGVCSGHTPPLFEYFSSTGLYGATATQDTSSINYEVETGGAPSCATGTTLFVDLIDNGTCDDAASDLASIQLAVFNVTILDANGLPVSNATSKIGSQVDNQVLLGNELTSGLPCGNSVIEGTAEPVAYYPLDDSGTPLNDLGTSSDSQAGTGGSVRFNQTPGPLRCNLANGGMSFDGSTAYTYSESSTLTGGFGNSVTIEAWIDPQNTGTVTCTSECAIVSDGDAIESSGYEGVSLDIEPSWKGVAVAANGQSSAGTGTVGVEPAAGAFTTACSSPNGPGSECWYFVAGVITATGSGSTAATKLTMYLCGPAVPSATSNGCAQAQSYTKTASGYGTITYSSSCDVMVGASPYSGTTACNSAAPGSTPPSQFFSGDIADAAVYETALTANQITTQYYEMDQ